MNERRLEGQGRQEFFSVGETACWIWLLVWLPHLRLRSSSSSAGTLTHALRRPRGRDRAFAQGRYGVQLALNC